MKPFFDIADGWNLIVVRLLKSWSRKIINYTFCVGNFFFFLLCFFGWDLCHVKSYDDFFIIIIISSLLLFFFSNRLTTLWISAHFIFHLQSYQQALNFPAEGCSVFCLFVFYASFSLWGDGAIFVISFCTWLKRSNCAKSLSTKMSISVLYWMYYGLLNKRNTFRFLTIIFLLWNMMKNTEDKWMNKEGSVFQHLYWHGDLVDGWTVSYLKMTPSFSTPA